MRLKCSLFSICFTSLHEQFSKVADATHPQPLVLPVRALPQLLLPYTSAIHPHIDIAVGIDFYVFSVGGGKKVQDVIAIEPGHSAPTAAANRTALQLSVVIGIDPVDERFYSYLTGHNINLGDFLDFRCLVFRLCKFTFLFLFCKIYFGSNYSAPSELMYLGVP